MRFAIIAAGAAAAFVIPFAVQAAGPKMSGDQFIEAVRCTAYEAVLSPRADLGARKLRLNAEAARHESRTVAMAHNAVKSVRREAGAVTSAADVRVMRAEQTLACAQAGQANGAGHRAA